MLEQQRGGGDTDLVAATDRHRRELELTFLPVEQAHQLVARSQRTVLRARLDLDAATLGEEHARDAEVDKEYVDVRKNMERLKALRLAKEAEDAANPPPVEPKKKKAAPKKLAIVKASEPEAVGGE